jgi:AAHS family 4-hydroxybenzoate transporter-like MFS transporter
MQVDVSKVIDRSPVGAFHWIVVVLGGLVTVIDGFDLVAMGIVVPTISADWVLEPAAFSAALSAALVGVLFGSAAAGSLGDIIGRRWTLILMLIICTLFMGLTVFVTSMNELIVYRFFTGVGAGGSIPVAIALTSEYMPEKYRNLLVTLMYTGAALGSVVAGFVGPALIESYGRQGIFALGSAMPAIAVVLLLLLLPESLRFLVTKRANPSKIARLIKRIDRTFQITSDQEFIVEEVTHKGAPVRELFGGRQTAITLVIWLVFFANQFMIFLVALWLPTVMVEGGLVLAAALLLVAIYHLGGAIGGPALGWVSDRYNAQTVLKISYPIAAVGLVAIGFSLNSEMLLHPLAFIAGGAAIGSSLCLGALTASLYPTRARSTGVGWALSVGRGGAIIAPMIGGVVLGWGTQGFFFAAAVAPLVAAAGMFLLTPLTRARDLAEATENTTIKS